MNWKPYAKIFRARALASADQWCEGYDEGHEVGYYEGAEALAAMILMAEAIRENYLCDDCGSWMVKDWRGLRYCYCEYNE